MKKLVQILCAVVFFSTTVHAGMPAIKIVGSSTVYPFTTVVAERFGSGSKFPTPIVESTGTGGGMKLFCAGYGPQDPSITNASRAIKPKEEELCEKNGVSWIEIAVGNDGIAFANSRQGPDMDVTKEQLWQAMAALGTNPTKWSDIDPSLPDMKIHVMVPPPTSGTRDAWNSLVMEKGCPAEIKAKDKKSCHLLREDGAMIEAGENDTLLVQKLKHDPMYFAIFGFSYLDSNRDSIKSAEINGKAISLDAIQDYSYPVARPLYIYIKKQHLGLIPGLRDFMRLYVSKKMMGNRGQLIELGLVPLDADTYKEMVKRTK